MTLRLDPPAAMLAVVAATMTGAACGSAQTLARPRTLAPTSLPSTVVEDCFIAASACRATGDFDGDGQPDAVLLVARTDGEHPRGFAVLWGAARPADVLGAGETTRVTTIDDDGVADGESTSALGDDLSYLARWEVLRAQRTTTGGLTLVGRVGKRHVTLPALPGLQGDALLLDGGDSAWVLYLSKERGWGFAPLGF